jgi:hypothetical protein
LTGRIGFKFASKIYTKNISLLFSFHGRSS